MRIPNNAKGLIIFRHDGSVAVKPGTLGQSGYRGRDPEEPWRRLYEQAGSIVRRWAGYEINELDLLDELYKPAGLQALPTWGWDDVVDIIRNPQRIACASDTLDALLDGRQPLEEEAEGLREALYQVLKARKQIEGSSRLKALQRLEACTKCKRLDFEVDPEDGTRLCECGHEWRFAVDVRVRKVNATLTEDGRRKRVEIEERTLVSHGRTLIQVEV